MSLTTVEQSILQSMPAHLQQWVSNRIEKKIKEIPMNKMARVYSEIIRNAFFDSGITTYNEDIIMTQTEALRLEITGRYKDLTISELKNCFYRGIRGESGPFFGICPKTYNQFLKWYFEHPDRQKSQIQFLDLLKAQNGTTHKPLHKIIDDSNKGILNLFKRYKLNNGFGSEGGLFAYYNVLNELNGVVIETNSGPVKTLIPDKSVRVKLTNECKDEYKAELLKAKSKAEFKRDKNLVSDIDLLISSLTSQPVFEQRLKVKFLKYYFDSINNLEL